MPGRAAVFLSTGLQVAILCNHQRSVPKTHGAQMEKIEGKLKELQAELAELTAQLKGKDKEGKAR